MSEELNKFFEESTKRIIANRYEPDKIHCIMSNLKQKVLIEMIEKERENEKV